MASFSMATFSRATVLIVLELFVISEPYDQRDSNDTREVVIESKDNQKMYQLTDEQNYVHKLNQLT